MALPHLTNEYCAVVFLLPSCPELLYPVPHSEPSLFRAKALLEPATAVVHVDSAPTRVGDGRITVLPCPS